MKPYNLKMIILTGMMLSVLLVLEKALMFLPNIQLTVVLIMVFAAILPGKLLFFLIVAYVLLDNLIIGSISLIYTPAMLIAWGLLAFVSRLIRNKSIFWVLLFAFAFGFIYGWVFIPFNMLIMGVDIFWPYFLADLPFEIVMAVNNYFTVLLLYKPLVTLLKEVTS